MVVFTFSIHNADRSSCETAGRMALTNDNAARAFGKAMIRDIMLGDNQRYSGWIMDVTKGERLVCSIPFHRNESRPTPLDGVGEEHTASPSAQL
jgi:hypothetical protein